MTLPVRPAFFAFLPFLLLLASVTAQIVPCPSVSFDIYIDSGKNYVENGWLGCGNGDTVTTSNAKWPTTFPDGPAFSGTDAILYEWEHKNTGWTAGGVARDWWIPINVQELVKYDGRVEFMAKSEKGGEDITVNLSDGEDINSPGLKVSSYLGGSALTKDWQKISIPFKDFTPEYFVKSENKIQTVGFGIDYSLIGKHKVYIDDIRLVHFYGNKEPEKGVLVRDLPPAVQVPEPKPVPMTGVVADKWRVAEAVDLSIAGIRQLGCKAVRLDFSWAAIEPMKGDFRFLDYENILAECKKNDITVLACVKGTPFWVRKTNNSDASAPADAFTRRPPADMTEWTAFMVHLATRYSDAIKYWEIWENEDESMSTKEYLELLGTAARAVKTIDPGAFVVSGCVKDTGFLQDIAASPACDILGFRIDGSAANPADPLQKLSSLKKPVWLTSAGAISGTVIDCKPRKQWMDKLLTAVKAPSPVKAIFWFELFDDNRDSVFPSSGLLDAGYQPKCGK